MRQITENVLRRLAHEKLLLINDIRPSRKRISLEEFLEAAKEEPRIYSTLPAIILFKPKIFYQLKKDLNKYPEIEEFSKNLFLEGKKPQKLFGLDKAYYQKVTRNFQRFLQRKKEENKSRPLNIRMSDEDFERLTRLMQKLQKKNISQMIRSLLEEKDEELFG